MYYIRLIKALLGVNLITQNDNAHYKQQQKSARKCDDPLLTMLKTFNHGNNNNNNNNCTNFILRLYTMS